MSGKPAELQPATHRERVPPAKFTRCDYRAEIYTFPEGRAALWLI